MKNFSEFLNESANSFAELPPSWKKLAVSNKLGGENSAVETVATKNSLNKISMLETQLRKVVNSSVNYQISWLEINGQEIVAVFSDSDRYGKETFSVITSDGLKSKGTKSIKHFGTGKWNKSGYISPKYYQIEKSHFTKAEAVYEVRHVLKYMSIDAFATDEEKEDVDKFFRSAKAEEYLEQFLKGAKLEMKALTSDENRKALKDERRENRKQANPRSANIRKAIASKIEKSMPKIMDGLIVDENVVRGIIDDALAGKKVDTAHIKTTFDEKYKLFASFVDSVRSMSTTDTFQHKDWSNKNAEASWATKDFFKTLKSIMEDAEIDAERYYVGRF